MIIKYYQFNEKNQKINKFDLMSNKLSNLYHDQRSDQACELDYYKLSFLRFRNKKAALQTINKMKKYIKECLKDPKICFETYKEFKKTLKEFENYRLSKIELHISIT